MGFGCGATHPPLRSPVRAVHRTGPALFAAYCDMTVLIPSCFAIASDPKVFYRGGKYIVGSRKTHVLTLVRSPSFF